MRTAYQRLQRERAAVAAETLAVERKRKDLEDDIAAALARQASQFEKQLRETEKQWALDKEAFISKFRRVQDHRIGKPPSNDCLTKGPNSCHIPTIKSNYSRQSRSPIPHWLQGKMEREQESFNHNFAYGNLEPPTVVEVERKVVEVDNSRIAELEDRAWNLTYCFSFMDWTDSLFLCHVSSGSKLG